MADKLPAIHAISNKAIELESEAERSRFLDEARQGDSQLIGRVEGLLRANSEGASFLRWRTPASAPTTDQSSPEKPSTIIGRYKLLEQISEGGFGVVFMAEQERFAGRWPSRSSDLAWIPKPCLPDSMPSGRHSRSWTIRTSPRYSIPGRQKQADRSS